MDTKKKIFEEQKKDFISQGIEEDALSQCERCYQVDEYEFLFRKGDNCYCEYCFDDLFVSWGDIIIKR